MLLLSEIDVCAALLVKCLFMGLAQVLSGDASTMKTEDDCVRPHICEFDGTTFAETSQSGRGLPDRPRAKTDDKTRDTTKCRRKLVHLPSQMLLTLLKWPKLSRNTFKSTFFRPARDRLRDRAIRLRSRDSETRSNGSPFYILESAIISEWGNYRIQLRCLNLSDAESNTRKWANEEILRDISIAGHYDCLAAGHEDHSASRSSSITSMFSSFKSMESSRIMRDAFPCD